MIRSLVQHCLADEVSWPTEEGDSCWFCGRPGLPGVLPGKLTEVDDYYGRNDARPTPGGATA